MKKYLHVISFDIPFPADYGGVIDVYYKIKALAEEGVKIILHCFDYRREPQEELNKICEKVYYYHRNTSIFAHISILPYTVYSRKNNILINNLLKDDYPILFEGLMSCYYLSDSRLSKRIKIVREANIEHNYYRNLARSTNRMVDKLYFLFESQKHKWFEKELNNADNILAISAEEEKELKLRFPNKNIEFIPAFQAYNDVESKIGSSDYILFHGNLSVPENERAALFLIKNVFKYLPYKCVVAGLNPTRLLENEASICPNVSIKKNLSDQEMQELIQNAHIHTLITFQATGLKLKLLNTLFLGRHVLVNETMLTGSGLDEVCHVANTSEELILFCEKLMKTAFLQENIEARRSVLLPQYSNRVQAQKIVALLK